MTEVHPIPFICTLVSLTCVLVPCVLVRMHEIRGCPGERWQLGQLSVCIHTDLLQATGAVRIFVCY